MSRIVIVSNAAEKKLEGLFEFLIEKWGLKVKSEFIKKLDRNIEIIKNNPESFPESENKQGLHKCVLTKKRRCITDTTIGIISVTLLNTRQNPNKYKAG